MKQFIVIIFFLIAIFVLASIDKRKVSKAKLLKNGIVLSSALCVITLAIWLLSLFCFEWRLDFPVGQNRYCEAGFFVGTVEICVTRYYDTPVIVERYEPNDSHRPDADLDYMPPNGIKFFSQWIDLPEGYPRLFKWSVEHDNSFAGVQMDDRIHKHDFTYIEIPYWFIAFLFAITPVGWWIRKRTNHLP